jgi:hypothetical protein
MLNFNLEGQIGLELTSINSFLISQTDKILMVD